MAENVPPISNVVPICGESLPPICSKTLANTGVPDSLSNSSLSFQEHLKDVTEKDIEILAPPEPLGGVPAASGDEWIPERIEEFRAMGGKVGDFMARSLERLSLRFQGKQIAADMDFYKDEFKLKYRWDIPTENLQQFCRLGQDLKTGFLEIFKQNYEAYGGGLFRCSNCFTKTMSCVTENAEAITTSIRKRTQRNKEYWEYIEARREELINTQPAN